MLLQAAPWRGLPLAKGTTGSGGRARAGTAGVSACGAVNAGTESMSRTPDIATTRSTPGAPASATSIESIAPCEKPTSATVCRRIAVDDGRDQGLHGGARSDHRRRRAETRGPADRWRRAAAGRSDPGATRRDRRPSRAAAPPGRRGARPDAGAASASGTRSSPGAPQPCSTTTARPPRSSSLISETRTTFSPPHGCDCSMRDSIPPPASTQLQASLREGSLTVSPRERAAGRRSTAAGPGARRCGRARSAAASARAPARRRPRAGPRRPRRSDTSRRRLRSGS